MTTQILKILNAGISLIAPEACPGCGIARPQPPYPVCASCRYSMLAASSPPFASLTGITEIMSCRSYEGAVKNCISDFKYRSNRRLLRVFDDIARYYLAGEGHKIHAAGSLLVPVPSHILRERSRGYNQAELIAGMLTEHISAPVLRRVLLKVRSTRAQAGLSREERMENLRGAFIVVDKRSVAGRDMILVDDVMTTGATLETCAAELMRAGARSVRAFTLARVI